MTTTESFKATGPALLLCSPSCAAVSAVRHGALHARSTRLPAPALQHIHAWHAVKEGAYTKLHVRKVPPPRCARPSWLTSVHVLCMRNRADVIPGLSLRRALRLKSNSALAIDL